MAGGGGGREDRSAEGKTQKNRKIIHTTAKNSEEKKL